MSRKIYLGNNPASKSFNPNIPAGNNKWDEQEEYIEEEQVDPLTEPCDEDEDNWEENDLPNRD
jgi:hypothetical protein